MQGVDLQKRLWNRYLCLPPGLRKLPIFLAVSGGMDSSVLASVALQLRERLPQLHFAHVNYHLRVPDSDLEEAALRSWAKRAGVPIHVLRLFPKAKPKNLQAWARERRLVFFRKLISTQTAGRGLVWMAHHQRDQAETVLARLLRGAGLKGLRGMEGLEEIDGLRVFRPWLEVPQEALRVYARAHRIAFHHDRSNDGLDYLRNRIRHRILPLLQEENPQILQALGEFAGRAGEATLALEGLAQAWLKRMAGPGKALPPSLNLAALRRQPAAVQAGILEFWLRQSTRTDQSWGRALPSLLSGIKAKKNFETPLKGGWRVFIYPEKLTLRRGPPKVRAGFPRRVRKRAKKP